MDAATPIYVIRAMLARTKPGVEPPSYHLGQPLLGVADSLIARMMVVDGAVEVFARQPSNPKKGYRFSLCAPTVFTVVSAGPAAMLTKFLTDLQTGESVIEVNDIEGFAWKLNEAPSGYPDLTIVKMVYGGDTVDVVAAANPGTEIAMQNVFFIFTLMPMSFIRVCTEAPLDAWIEMQAELEEMLADDGDDGDEDDDEENEIAEQVQAAASPPKLMAVPPPPPALNGTAAVPEALPQSPPNQE